MTTREPQPAWWALYLGIGLLGIVVLSKIAVGTMPPMMKRAFDDPTTVWFKSSEMHGRTCEQMAEEAKQRGAAHWICLQ